jgi:hypothetical protein
MKESMEKQWYVYIETPRTKSSLVKLDQILAERLKAFMKAKYTTELHLNNNSKR